MKRPRFKYVLPVILAILGIFGVMAPALAIDDPTTLQIEGVWAYQNARENGDQLYIIEYDVDFDDLPDENIDNTFIFRILDAADDELRATTAYAFYNRGYGLGVVAFYFEADEAPGWEGSYSVQVSGMPGLNWTGDPPLDTTGVITWTTANTTAMNEYVSARIAYLAAALEQAWAVEMTDTVMGNTILSDSGLDYFLRVVPYLTDVAPYVLNTYVYEPTYPEESVASDTYGDSLLTALTDTIFDIGFIEADWGIQPTVVTTTIYYILVVAFFILLIRKHKLSKGTMLLAWPFVIAGMFFGVPIIVTALGAFFCVVNTAVFFYKGTS